MKIVICMGSSCFARGNNKNLEILEKYIAGNNLESKVQLYGSCCEGKCADGPFIKVDGKAYRCPDEGTLVDILNSHLTGKAN